MTEAAVADPAARLEAAFTRIWKTRMQGLPFLNPALRVEAVGFRAWQGEWLGVLVTPWSREPRADAGRGRVERAARRAASASSRFPAGRFRFIAGSDDELGEYHACSLFSPALEFADHEAGARHRAGRARWRSSTPPTRRGPTATSRRSRREPGEISKRDFLRGRFAGASHGDRG